MKFHVTVGKKTNVSTNKDPSLLNSRGRIAKFVSKPSRATPALDDVSALVEKFSKET